MDNKQKGYDLYFVIFIATTIFFFIVWVILIFSQGYNSSQFSFFFDRCADLFADFTNVCGYSQDRDVYRNTVNSLAEKGYPPLPYMISYFFARFESEYPTNYFYSYVDTRFLIMFVLATVFIMVVISLFIYEELLGNNAMKLLGALILSFSATNIYLVERGNYMLLTELFCLVYILWYDSDSRVRREIALVAFSFAVGLKIVPAILGVFLLYDKRFIDALKVIIYSAALVILPFLFFEGGLNNIPLMFQNAALFLEKYSNLTGIGLTADIFIVAKSFNVSFIWSDELELFSRIFAFGLSAIIILFSWIFDRKVDKVVAVTLVMIILPKYSSSYNVAYFIPAIVLFLNDRKRRTGDVLCLIAFLLINITIYINELNANQWSVLLLIVYTCYRIMIMAHGVQLPKKLDFNVKSR